MRMAVNCLPSNKTTSMQSGNSARGLLNPNPIIGKNSMSNHLSRKRCSCNCALSPVPTFLPARQHSKHPTSYAARHLQRTRHLTASTAALYASLAGFKVEDSE